MTNTKAKGDITEAMVAVRLLQTGVAVLKPFGDNQRYDLVTDDGVKFTRVQCKTGRLTNGCIEFSTKSTGYAGKRSSYQGQVDVFGVYCQEVDKVYIVPIEDCGTSNKKLRYEVVSYKAKEENLASKYELK